MQGGGLADLVASPLLWLALLPIALVLCTAFAKITIVLGALRIGLGARELLPYGLVFALGLLLTALVMAPVARDIWLAVELRGGPAALGDLPWTAWLDVVTPLREFLTRHASEAELAFFADLTGSSAEDPQVLVSAFLITELGEALHVAVLVLLPFVLVDLLLAEILTLVGVPQLPVATVALPTKVLLFLAAGGWDIIVSGLVEAYA